MANKQVKMFSTSLIINEIKIKLAMKLKLNLQWETIRLSKITKINNTKGYWQCEATRTLVYW